MKNLHFKFQELQTRGKFSQEDILTCLTAHHGDLEAAFLELSKTQLKPFLMRIWGPPAGAENESGNMSNLLEVQKKPSLSTDNNQERGEGKLFNQHCYF